jgi:hypothetical protein
MELAHGVGWKKDPENPTGFVSCTPADYVAEIEHLREGLKRIVGHDPKTPGLRYDSIEQLLDSAVGTARIWLGE